MAAALILGLGGILHGGGVPVSAQGAVTIQITGPTNAATVSNPVQMHVTSSGVTIKPATAGDASAAHYHYFLDRNPSTVLQQGQPIPAGQADIIHTDDANLILPNLAPGQHTVWVVLAHTDHTPFNPNVQAQVSFTVGAAAGAPAAGGANGLPRAGMGPDPVSMNRVSLLLALAAGVGVLSLAGFQLSRRRTRP